MVRLPVPFIAGRLMTLSLSISAWSRVLAYAAFACLLWSSVAGADNVALGAARIGMPPATTGALLTGIANVSPVGLATGVFP